MKMRLVLIALLLLHFGNHADAQDYFNKRLTLNSNYSTFVNAKQVGDKYYAIGVGADSSYLNLGYYGQGIRFSVFDLHGNLIRDTFYIRDSFVLSYYYSNAVFTSDGQFVFPVYAFNDSEDITLLLCMDTLGHVVWEKEFPKPVCTDNPYYYTYDIEPTGTGEWLMLSHSHCYMQGNPQYRLRMLLTKLDSNFNVIWHKLYGMQQWYNLPNSLLIEPDGYVMAGLHSNYYQSSILGYRAEMIKVDTAGDQLWLWTSDPTKLTNTILDVIKTQDGGYVYCGQGDGFEHLNGGTNPSTMYWRNWVEKLDANRNVVWNRVIAPWRITSDYNELVSLKELPDGSIVVGGTVAGGYGVADTSDVDFASLVKLDANGNLVWQRQYNYQGYNYCYKIKDMQLTSDGGFILVGDALNCRVNQGDMPIQRAWILKVDSNGCEQSMGLCNPTEVAQSMQPTRSLKVYPNPANDLLYIEHGAQTLSYHLVNITGATMLQGLLPKGKNSLSLQGLAPGMYILHAGDEVHKVIKE